jgi:hypothetical protein
VFVDEEEVIAGELVSDALCGACGERGAALPFGEKWPAGIGGFFALPEGWEIVVLKGQYGTPICSWECGRAYTKRRSDYVRINSWVIESGRSPQRYGHRVTW